MTKFECQEKECPNKGITFEWDNVDAADCRACGIQLTKIGPIKAVTK